MTQLVAIIVCVLLSLFFGLCLIALEKSNWEMRKKKLIEKNILAAEVKKRNEQEERIKERQREEANFLDRLEARYSDDSRYDDKEEYDYRCYYDADASSFLLRAYGNLISVDDLDRWYDEDDIMEKLIERGISEEELDERTWARSLRIERIREWKKKGDEREAEERERKERKRRERERIEMERERERHRDTSCPDPKPSSSLSSGSISNAGHCDANGPSGP